jgi:hypothetical protein
MSAPLQALPVEHAECNQDFSPWFWVHLTELIGVTLAVAFASVRYIYLLAELDIVDVHKGGRLRILIDGLSRESFSFLLQFLIIGGLIRLIMSRMSQRKAEASARSHLQKLIDRIVTFVVTVVQVSRESMHCIRSFLTGTDTSQGSTEIHAERQFRAAFLILLLTWLLLYLALTAFNAISAPPAHQMTGNEIVILNFLNNLCTLGVLLCYAILRHRTLGEKAWSTRVSSVVALIALVALGGLEFSVEGSPEAADAFGWISAIAACMSIALLSEELGSPEIGAPSVLVALLYCYAGVQMVWPFVINNASAKGLEPINLIAPLIALVGKFVLALLIVWSSDVGRLRFYIFRTRQRLEKIPSERQTYLSPTS